MDAAASEIIQDFQFAKRKRSKRNRILLPSAAASSTESNATGGEEDEDMANCLILLAQGRSPGPPGKLTSRRFTEAATTTGGRAGFYVYECKTCSKCFSSFQALGGHRASHKRPKPPASDEPISLQISLSSSSKKPSLFPRIHECSVCGSEFSSGQALGGHMRRHRPAAVPEGKRERQNFLSLDLNLPAPSDEALGLSFGDNTPMVLGTLVDCHY